MLMASPPDGAVLGVCTGADWWAARRALEAEEVTFGAFLTERGLVLRADLLGAWAHWVTPEFEPRRFSTRFFVAVLPESGIEGDEPTHSREADASLWIEPGAAVHTAESGGMALMPPTRHNILELQRVGCVGVEAVVTGVSQRRIPTVSPRLIEVDGDHWLTSVLDSELDS